MTRARWVCALSPSLLAIVLSLVGCSRHPSEPRDAGVVLNLVASRTLDDRVYSVGRVQLRAVDADGQVLASQIFFIDRATGVFDLDFDLPAGPARRILVEPLGSGILPGGGKTESGVALQGVSEPFDLAAGGAVTITVPLEPFIPDQLRTQQSPVFALGWDAMPPARAHTVRVLERSGDSAPLTSRLVSVGRPPVAIAHLESAGRTLVGVQVRSENEFSSSAFSDTLFFAPLR